jgi:spore germination cell wall hydrolase CwlJ-like protein
MRDDTLETTPRTKGSFIKGLVKFTPLMKCCSKLRHQMKGEIMVDKLTKLAIFLIAALATVLSIKAVAELKITSLKENLNWNDEAVVTAEQRKKDLDCLALNIYREAAREPFEGKVAVAQVTINRVENNQFPNTICGVVYEKNMIAGRIICQFSWYCDSTHRNRPINKDAYNESMTVAKQVLLEGFKLPSLDEALFYHADYINPNWRYDRITKVGTHIFYKPKERLQHAKL